MLVNFKIFPVVAKKLSLLVHNYYIIGTPTFLFFIVYLITNRFDFQDFNFTDDVFTTICLK